MIEKVLIAVSARHRAYIVRAGCRTFSNGLLLPTPQPIRGFPEQPPPAWLPHRRQSDSRDVREFLYPRRMRRYGTTTVAKRPRGRAASCRCTDHRCRSGTFDRRGSCAGRRLGSANQLHRSIRKQHTSCRRCRNLMEASLPLLLGLWAIRTTSSWPSRSRSNQAMPATSGGSIPRSKSTIPPKRLTPYRLRQTPILAIHASVQS